MARYRALAPMYLASNRYVEIGQIIADDGTGDVPIPTSFVPSVACDPLDASAVAKMTAIAGNLGQPSGSQGIIGLWGPRSQFSTLPLPAPSDAWKALVHP
jgi:hypothetical protein